MTLRSNQLAAPILVASALALAGFIATPAQAGMPPPPPPSGECVEADCPCPDQTVTSEGGGGGPRDEIVTHSFFGSIPNGGGDGLAAGDVDVCSGATVAITITGGTRLIEGDGDCNLAGNDPGPFSCSITVGVPGDDVETYRTESLEGTKKDPDSPNDVDVITLRPRGPAAAGPELGRHICLFDSSGDFCLGGTTPGAPCFDPTGLLIPGECPGGGICLAKSRAELRQRATPGGILPFPLFGAGDFDCGAVDPSTGKAVCSCDIIEIAPITIPLIGVICVTPSVEACPLGEIECDGGNALDIDTVADHTILNRDCTSQEQCARKCVQRCRALDKDFVTSGCEGFCSDGNMDPCRTDLACLGTCSGGSGACNLISEDPDVLDCPSGETCDFGNPQGDCTGADELFFGTGVPGAGNCTCTCNDLAFGAASPPGAIQCQLGAAFNVEFAEPCGTDVKIGVGDVCFASTSGTSTNVLLNANIEATEAAMVPPQILGACALSGATCGNDAECDAIIPGDTCGGTSATGAPVPGACPTLDVFPFDAGSCSAPASGTCPSGTCVGGVLAGFPCAVDAQCPGGCAGSSVNPGPCDLLSPGTPGCCNSDDDCPGLMPSGTFIPGFANFFDSGLGDINVLIQTACAICGDGVRNQPPIGPSSEQCDGADDGLCIPVFGGTGGCEADCTCTGAP